MAQPDASADALAAKPLTQVITLTRWVGTGRTLTETGRLTMADARELVPLLQTGDEIDRAIGDRVFRTRSSEDLRGLNIILTWAKAAGLVRVQHGRLVSVRKNAPLLDRPLQLWATMLTVFNQLSDAIYPSKWFSSLLADNFADGVALLLSDIAEHGGALTIGDASEVLWNTLVARYRTDDLSEDHVRTWRQGNDRDVRRMVDELVKLGALTVDEHDTVRLTPLTERVLRRGYGPDEPGEAIAQIKVTLLHTKPAVWRRVLVPANLRLDRLHRVIQAAMGWQGYHLHMFTHGDDSYGVPDPDLDLHDDRKTTMDRLVAKPGDSIVYEYDFGDSWDHEILLEELVTAEAGGRYPRCVDGARACPPEDAGGTGGYQALIKGLANPKHPEHEHLREWLGLTDGVDFDPARFDLDEANARLDATIVAGLPTA